MAVLARLMFPGGWGPAPSLAVASQLIDAAPNVETPPETEARRIVVARFQGRGADLIRTAVVDGLGENVAFRMVAVRLLEVRKDAAGERAAPSEEFIRRLRLTALVGGRVTKAGRDIQATLSVINAKDGVVLATFDFKARNLLDLHAKVRAEVVAKLGPLIQLMGTSSGVTPDEARALSLDRSDDATSRVPAGGRDESVARSGDAPERASNPLERIAAAPAVPPPALTAPPPRGSTAPRPGYQRATTGRREHSPSRCDIVEMELGGGAIVRRYDYRDEQRGALRAYALARAPVGRIEGAFYPWSGENCRSGLALGLRGAYELMAPLDSFVADRALETSAFAYQAEVVLRISSGAFTIKPSVGYFARRFVVKGDVVPSVDHRALGGGIDGVWRIGNAVVEVGTGVRRMLSAGELKSADWFPEATGFVYAGRVRAGVAVTPWLDFFVGVTGEYHAISLNPAMTGPYPNGVADGAYDAYLLGLGAVRFHLSGSAPPAR